MKLGLSCNMYHSQKPKWKVILSEHAEEDNDTDVITLITFCELQDDANSGTVIQRYVGARNSLHCTVL